MYLFNNIHIVEFSELTLFQENKSFLFNAYSDLRGDELNLYIIQRRTIFVFFWWSFMQGLVIATGTM